MRVFITHPKTADDALKIEEISEYVKSLQQSIIYWFYIHNPSLDQSDNLTDYQTKLVRLSIGTFKFPFFF